MRIFPGDVAMIGRKIRKPQWTHCVGVVVDVGHRFVLVDILDVPSGLRREVNLFSLDQDWEFFHDVKEVLAGIAVKER